MFALLLSLLSAAQPQVVPRPRIAALGDSSQKCIFCEFYVSMIIDYLEDGATIEEITKKVDQLCNYVTPALQPLCTSLVDTFLPEIIKYIDQKLTKAEICVLIKLCRD